MDQGVTETKKENPWQELTRLVAEYSTGEGSEREEAWNLLADFTLEHWIDIAGALEFAALSAARSERSPHRGG